MNSRVIFVCMGLVLLSACSNEYKVKEVPSVGPTFAVTATRSFTPTKTALPSGTPSPTPRPTNTIPVATLNVVATTDAVRANLVSQFPELEQYNSFCNPRSCGGVEASPNGQWIYFTNSSEMEILDANGKRLGKYSSQEISGRTGFSEGWLGGGHWSNDGRYLYVTTSFGDGGAGPYFGYKYSLARINLENGTWRDTGISGVISFSPNDKYIVFSPDESQVRLRNLQSGEEHQYFSSDYYQYFGDFVWSPDGSKVVFVSVPEDWDVSQGPYALYMIDLDKNEMIKIYENSLPFYYPVQWSEENKVLLRKDQGVEELILDLSTDPPNIQP
jgi:Tol biopolymer transport system component